MSYQTILEGLHERFATIPGLAEKPILDYEPSSVQDVPMLYSLLDSLEREYEGSVVVMRYRILSRLLFRWQNNEVAERELVPYVNAIPAAVDLDPSLGARLPGGDARVVSATGVFVSIGGVVYRALDFISEVEERGLYQIDPI